MSGVASEALPGEAERPNNSPEVWIYALGAIGLGLTGIMFRDFALQWQPVPAIFPMRAAVAVIIGVGMCTTGLVLLVPRLTLVAAAVAATFDVGWWVVLMLPRVVREPSSLVAWLGLAEIGVIAAGAIMIVATFTSRDRLASYTRMFVGGCALIFGLSHFVYPSFTAAMVPGWLPAPLAWAYATGAGHVLAGLALVSGIKARLAATLLAAMCGSFVVLLHLPRVVAAPTVHAEWVMLFIALSISGASAMMRYAGDSIARH
ncbi:DoxX family protein [Sphingomonas antarctica]|uniref:DoxX family membrane protein n=1 Tax=Sphingomonas antarctica TaxID=2040274 RepID=UPI0039E97F9D